MVNHEEERRRLEVAAERRQIDQVAAEIRLVLGDRVARKSFAWWHYYGVVRALGDVAVWALAMEAVAVHAAGGILTKDGTRPRSKGGVFFVLVAQKLGSKRTYLVKEHARIQGVKHQLKSFLRLFEAAWPAEPAWPEEQSRPALRPSP